MKGSVVSVLPKIKTKWPQSQSKGLLCYITCITTAYVYIGVYLSM